MHRPARPAPSGQPRRPLARLGAALCALYLLLTATPAAATSCKPFDDQYFLSCDKAGCQAVFRATEVPALGLCSRRPVVEDVDPQVGAYLASIVAASGNTAPDGIYELHFPVRGWWHRKGGTWEDFKQNLDGALNYELGPHCVGIAKPAEVAQLLNRQYPDWLVRKAGATAASLQAERQALERQALLRHLLTILAHVAYWGSSLLAFLALVHSVHLYFSRLYAAEGPPPPRRLAAPLGIQFLVCLAGAGALLLAPYDFWPGTILVPAGVVLLFAEGWARFRRRRTSN